MAEVNFTVKPDALAVIRNTVIEANFDECKAALTEMMRPYQTLVVTEDGIAAAKNDRARIRKVAAGIDEMRKTVKRTYNEPLKAFEDKCKELISICEDGSGNLDRQVKEYEEREADAKIARLRAVYDAAEDEEAKEYCPWEKAYNAKWRNKGYDEDAAKGEIANALLMTREDLETIRTMEPQDVPYLLGYYEETHDLSAVIRKSSALKARREEAQRRAEEAARMAREEERRKRDEAAQSANTAAAEKSKVVYVPSETAATNEPEELPEPLDFRVWATKDQLMALKAFLKSNGIRYGRVPG